MDIQPASLSQVLTGRDGKFILVDDDVQNVAKDLAAIDPSLRLKWNERGEYFVVYQEVKHEDGRTTEHLVTTTNELDQRLVARVRKVAQPDYDLAAELDRLDAEENKRRESELTDWMGDQAERLGFAMRKDLGHADHRIFVPAAVGSGV